MDVTINENQINVPAEIATWGDLLDWLETDHLKAGQCITHVALGGEETLNYRDTLICDQDLAQVGNVDVKSGDFDAVVSESLSELDQELKAALASTGEIVTLFENRQEEEAYARLAALLDSVRIFFTIFSEDLGWAEVPDAEISREEYSAALERALTQLISAQENRFWVSICDVIEYEINPILEAWQKLAERTRARIN
jgi:macrodomain Ter protein organizer (MatP/YcbG family)